MKSLAKIIAENKAPVITVKPDDRISSAIKTMNEKNIGALLVMDGSTLVGILSERDLVRKLLPSGNSAKDTLVSAIMTERPYCADLKKTVEACIATMSEHRFRHLPVLDEKNKVVGIVSMGDLVKELIKEQAFMIDQFERFVSAGTY
ncbi:MAG: histidine kinase [Spirochaetae bacterium HGW-Spirochaetae-7]|jgi:CBS domain-containing protein|nr:MAG: histidine kinase [Spirochaetae bacterium HGW-Spirochaetae-7]